MSQYAYFSLTSDEVTAAEISAELGLEADEVRVRGSRTVDPARPACHAWLIYSRRPGLPLDDHITEVLDRIRPVAAVVRALVNGGRVEADLQIVRYFNDQDGQDDLPDPWEEDGHTYEKLPGQHHMLGWFIQREQLELLVRMGAAIDADEYG